MTGKGTTVHFVDRNSYGQNARKTKLKCFYESLLTILTGTHSYLGSKMILLKKCFFSFIAYKGAVQQDGFG
jgi:hypothetical protein